MPPSWRKDSKVFERKETVLSEQEYERLKTKLKALGSHRKSIARGVRKSDDGIQPVDEQAKALLARVKRRIEGQ